MDDDDTTTARAGGRGPRRLLVLGANGPTGREVVQQGLDRGHEVHALTRHPEGFPLRHERLRVVAGDATDRSTIEGAVAATDAVISAIGARFTLGAVDVYSMSAHLLVTAMSRRGGGRLVVVTSSGVPRTHPRDGFLQRTSSRLLRETFGRTVYDDMTRLEAYVSSSDLDWTIVRPPGLLTRPKHGYDVAEGEIEGMLCTRADLAEMLLDQLDDDRFLRRIAAVSSPGLTVGAVEMVRTEMLKR
jgi:putative NADH-flavin reductase